MEEGFAKASEVEKDDEEQNKEFCRWLAKVLSFLDGFSVYKSPLSARGCYS